MCPVKVRLGSSYFNSSLGLKFPVSVYPKSFIDIIE